jgi:hypothetical protein
MLLLLCVLLPLLLCLLPIIITKANPYEHTCSPGAAASRAAHASHWPDMSDLGKATSKQLAPPAAAASGAPTSEVAVADGAACGHRGSCRHSPAGLADELPSAGAVQRCSWRPAALLLLLLLLTATSANPASACTSNKKVVGVLA